jgi:hypothetical protein
MVLLQTSCYKGQTQSALLHAMKPNGLMSSCCYLCHGLNCIDALSTGMEGRAPDYSTVRVERTQA